MCACWAVRTTIELPDGLFRAAKTLSVAGGQTLKEFFTAAVERAVREASDLGSRRMIRPPIRGGDGPPIPARSNRELAAVLEDDDLDKAR